MRAPEAIRNHPQPHAVDATTRPSAWSAKQPHRHRAAPGWSPVDHERAGTMKKRVLIISFDYPPRRTSAVHRMTAMTRYITDHGWEPTVLTIREERDASEPALLEKLPPHVRIVRTPYLRLMQLDNQTATLLRRAGFLPANSNRRGPSLIGRWLRQMAALVRSTLYFPDETAGWIPFALLQAVRLHMERPFDLVYTTTPPRAAPVVGLLLKDLFGVPWVSEFMDPWYPKPQRLRARADSWLYTHVMLRADRVVVMMQGHADELIQRQGLPAEKFAVVRNGFWEEDFAALDATPAHALPHGFIHLSHFGTVYHGNEGKFFEALAELLGECPELKARLRLNIGGYPHSGIVEFIRNSVLNEITEFYPYLSDRTQVLQMLRASDFLLLLWGRPDYSRQAIAGKTYDYLRTGRPILAVTSPGGIQELIEGADAGWVLPPEDPARIKEILKSVLKNYRKNDALPRPRRPEFVAQFRWDRQAERLARVFEETVAHAR